jgi:hypothetical protein
MGAPVGYGPGMATTPADTPPDTPPDPVEPDYHCPGCSLHAYLILGPTQAFCGNTESCRVLMFNPSLPDGGLSQAGSVNLDLGGDA